MPAYLIAEIEVTDPEKYQQYVQQAPDTIAQFGGRYLVRGGDPTPLEGGWEPKRMVVLEFESLERAKAWYHSEQYQRIVPIRWEATRSKAVLVNGQ